MRPLYLVFLLLLALPTAYASRGTEETKLYDIAVEPHKKVLSPEEVMVVKITVKDKVSGGPVINALVEADISIYQGGYVRETVVQESGRQVYLVEKVITKKVKGVKAEEIGKGVYMLSQKIDTQALWGGVTITVSVSKGEKTESTTRSVSFMGFSAFWYAALVTIFAMLAGSSVGLIFGHVSKH